MKTDVEILIKTKIIYPNGEEERIESQFIGNLYKKDEQFFLRYQENSNQEMGSTWTTIKWNIDDSSVTILRQGDVKMKQVFAKNKDDHSHYYSPYGILEMKTTTHNLTIDHHSSSSGRIDLNYGLSVNSDEVGQYWLQVVFNS